jgi:pimeloyl-ACP methyl ester carboxylesterase
MQSCMGTARALVVLGLGAVLFLALAGSAWGARERARDPLTTIHRAPGEVRVLKDSSYEAITAAGEARTFRDLVVETTGAGTIRVTTSRPAAEPDGPMPLVMVLAGLRTGRESLAFLDAHGPNKLVGYEYPYNQENFYQRSRVSQLPAIRRAILDVPAQVTLVADMLARDPAVDPERTALLGFSFGAMFVPAVQRVAAAEGRPFDAMIMAYGGADIAGLLDANLRVRSGFLRGRIAATGATLVHAMEPGHHLPRISGRFLVIHGDQDAQIPTVLAEGMAELTPEPKEIVVLAAGHMGPSDPALTARVVAISQDWLVREGVVEPPPDLNPRPSGPSSW